MSSICSKVFVSDIDFIARCDTLHISLLCLILFIYYTVSWLYHLKSYEYAESIRLGATEQQMLDSMINKAKEANFTSLQSLGELGKAAKKLQQAIIR